MPIASGSDYAFLGSHEFFKHYYAKPPGDYQGRLTQLGKESFEDIKRSGIFPLPFDVALALEYFDLPGSTVYADLIADLCAKVSLPSMASTCPSISCGDFDCAGKGAGRNSSEVKTKSAARR